jgi:hypothetical protein
LFGRLTGRHPEASVVEQEKVELESLTNIIHVFAMGYITNIAMTEYYCFSSFKIVNMPGMNMIMRFNIISGYPGPTILNDSFTGFGTDKKFVVLAWWSPDDIMDGMK